MGISVGTVATLKIEETWRGSYCALGDTIQRVIATSLSIEMENSEKSLITTAMKECL